MNRMLVVSTCRNSCCGCLRPPCGGTEATVPSMIFSSACCTPSPDTSRVIEGLSDLRRNLVDFVDVDDAALGALDIVVGRLQQLQDDVLHVLADIAGFGQRGGVGHGEGHVEDARQRLRQQRLARTRRARSAGCSTWPVRHRCAWWRGSDACSGCARRPRARAWPGTGRSRSRREPCRSPSAWECRRLVLTSADLFSSRMMSMQSSTHSSQMNTVGPAISLRTSCWLLPQKEQYSVFFESPPPPCSFISPSAAGSGPTGRSSRGLKRRPSRPHRRRIGDLPALGRSGFDSRRSASLS